MNHLAAAAILALSIAAPASAQTISITQNGGRNTAPLSYAVINNSGGPIMLSTTGRCGAYQRPMKPAAKLYATCSPADGKATIAATTYPGKRMLCAAHIRRHAGVNYTTFDKTDAAGACRERQSLNHIEVVVATIPVIRARR